MNTVKKSRSAGSSPCMGEPAHELGESPECDAGTQRPVGDGRLLGMREHLDQDHAGEARAQREHAEAIAALTGPALASLPVSAQRAAQTPGTNLHLALGMCVEMLLPIKQRLDRLDARVDANHDDLQQQIDLLRAALREVRS